MASNHHQNDRASIGTDAWSRGGHATWLIVSWAEFTSGQQFETSTHTLRQQTSSKKIIIRYSCVAAYDAFVSILIVVSMYIMYYRGSYADVKRNWRHHNRMWWHTIQALTHCIRKPTIIKGKTNSFFRLDLLQINPIRCGGVRTSSPGAVSLLCRHGARIHWAFCLCVDAWNTYLLSTVCCCQRRLARRRRHLLADSRYANQLRSNVHTTVMFMLSQTLLIDTHVLQFSTA